MSSFCPKCGKKLENDALRCSFCGSAVELSVPEGDEDVTVYTPKRTRPSRTGVRAVLAKTPKAVWAASAMVLVGAVALLIAGSVLSQRHSKEQAAAKFQTAMETADFALLSQIAAPSDATILFTQTSVQPMFQLYADSSSFRKEAKLLLAGQSQVFHLRPEKHVLYTGYTVSIDACELTVNTNIAGATVQVDGQSATTQAQEVVVPALDGTTYSADYTNLVQSSVTVSNLLPGVHTVQASFTSCLGESFETSGTASFSGDCAIAMNFNYASIYVWNSSPMNVELSVDGQDYTTLSADMTLQIAPLHPDATVSAIGQTAMGQTMTQTVSASDNYLEIRFALGRLEIYNDYDTVMDVVMDDGGSFTIQGKSAYVLDAVPVGTTLSCSLQGYDIFQPFEYQVEYDYDSIYPILSLSEQSSATVAETIRTYLCSLPAEGAPETELAMDLERFLDNRQITVADFMLGNITVDSVYDVSVDETSLLLRLNGVYDYTLNQPEQPADAEEMPEEAPADDALLNEEEQPDTEQPEQPEEQLPQQKRFDVELVYDGENWAIVG